MSVQICRRRWRNVVLAGAFSAAIWASDNSTALAASSVADSWVQASQERMWRQPARQYPYHDCFVAAAKANSLPLALVLAVARGESNFNTAAVSSKNARGIMQIQWPDTANDLGIFRRQDLTAKPCTNIHAGAQYLKQLLDRYNQDVHRALAAYNYGPGRIPPGGDLRQIPVGAQVYSAYIMRHLGEIVGGEEAPSQEPVITAVNRAPAVSRQYDVVIRFGRLEQARGLANHLQSLAANAVFEWQPGGDGGYAVIHVYRNEQERIAGNRLLDELGFSRHG